MNFTVARATLADALSLLSSVSPRRSPKPILQNIRLAGGDDGFLSLSATDLEIGVCYRLPVEQLTDPESLLLPTQQFQGIARDDWSAMLSFRIENARAEIKSDNGTFTLMGSDDADFPAIADLPEGNILELQAEDLRDAVGRTAFSTAKSDARFALNGIFLRLDMESKSVNFVATDTHRLSICRKRPHAMPETMPEAIVLTKGLGELAKLAEGEELIRIGLTSHELVAETSRARLVSRLVDGQFPRYQEVIPQKQPHSATVDRENLQRNLRLAGQLSNSETHSVTFRYAEGVVFLEAAGAEAGNANLRMEAKVTGEGAIAFNYHYLHEVLGVLREQDVTLQLGGDNTPARINEGDFTHVIMPIRGQAG